MAPSQAGDATDPEHPSASEATDPPSTPPALLDEQQLLAALEHEHERARTSPEHAHSLLALGIDGYDDEHGSSAGNRAMQAIIDTVRAHVRAVDILARPRSDKLAILLPGQDVRRAARLAEKLRTAIESQPIDLDNRNVTVSLGVAADQPWFDRDELIHEVNARLRRAKRLGPSCVISSDDEECIILRRDPTRRNIRLIVIHGAQAGHEYDIGLEALTIGRAPDDDIRVNDGSVSRSHATLTIEDNGATLTDNDSKNGTYVNGRRVPHYHLKDGDVIQVGQALFELRDGDERAYHMERDRRFTTVDGLTQTFNRRYFTDTLEREVSRARRYERPLAVMMLDVDDFARVNDAHGGVVGDEALRKLAELMRDSSRKVDVVARIDGDIFGVIVPELDLDTAAGRAESLRAAIEQRRFECSGHPLSLTVSIGVAALAPDLDAEALRELATERMRRAKQLGRNRVVSA